MNQKIQIVYQLQGTVEVEVCSGAPLDYESISQTLRDLPDSKLITGIESSPFGGIEGDAIIPLSVNLCDEDLTIIWENKEE